jgi:hypothetical protein
MLLLRSKNPLSQSGARTLDTDDDTFRVKPDENLKLTRSWRLSYL